MPDQLDLMAAKELLEANGYAVQDRHSLFSQLDELYGHTWAWTSVGLTRAPAQGHTYRWKDGVLVECQATGK